MEKILEKTHKDFPLNYSSHAFKPAYWMTLWYLAGAIFILTEPRANQTIIILYFGVGGALMYIRNIIARITGIFLPDLILMDNVFTEEKKKQTCREYGLYRVPDIFTIIFYEVPRRIWKIIKHWRNK